MRTLDEKTDSELFALLILDGPRELPTPILYKALAFTANTGHQSDYEQLLEPSQRKLLEVRRNIFDGKIKMAHNQLQRLINKQGLKHLLLGDGHFLLGVCLHRLNKSSMTALEMDMASQEFYTAQENYRYLRSKINQEICKGELESYNSGALYVLQQKALRYLFFDLAGNISKSKMAIYLQNGLIDQSINEGENALRYYQISGCSEDRAVLEYTLAISYFLNNEPLIAKTKVQSTLQHGKHTLYKIALENLFSGKKPSFPKGHPLAEIKWKTFLLRSGSIAGKIIECLKLGPKSKEELIHYVWGDYSDNYSYHNRLHTAIKSLRQNQLLKINYTEPYYILT